MNTKIDPIVEVTNVYRNNLRTNYSFNNFVVGASNMLAFRLAMKIADQPGMVANPFYIFGSVGLGKTHLMQAIGNYILDIDITKNVLYVKADVFIEDYSKFCKGVMPEFEEKYRKLDILLIDDIQVLEIGKKSQLEFFKFFDYLKDENKQIVITSDRPADKLNIMDRLTTRFEAGLTVNIETPNLDHRVSILRKKVLESTQAEVSDDVLEYIASNFTNNIRALEGGLTRVLFFCETINVPITLETTQEALAPLLSNKRIAANNNESNFTNVQDIVSSFFNISVDDIIGKKRTANIVLARHIAMYILKNKYGLSYKKIGSLFSNRDHSTIISGCEKIEHELKTNEEVKLAYDTIMKKID